jgi:hypothetical protein
MTKLATWGRDYFWHFNAHADYPGCGLAYVRAADTDQNLHRTGHYQIISTFDPKPNAALKNRRNAVNNPFVPVTEPWMHERLGRIMRVLTREIGYDFLNWRYGSSGGYLVADADGRALGGFAVIHGGYDDRWKNQPFLDWIWIAPPYRRRGLMKQAWAMLSCRYPSIIAPPPYTEQSAPFFEPLLRHGYRAYSTRN